MAGPAAHDFMVDEVLSASVLNNSVVDRISYYAGQELGSDDASEIEAALRILSGSGGRFLGVPGGTTGQRPTGAAGRFRRNTTTGVLEYHDGSGWVSLLEANAVTAAALIANGGVGTASDQAAYGDHEHVGRVISEKWYTAQPSYNLRGVPLNTGPVQIFGPMATPQYTENYTIPSNIGFVGYLVGEFNPQGAPNSLTNLTINGYETLSSVRQLPQGTGSWIGILFDGYMAQSVEVICTFGSALAAGQNIPIDVDLQYYPLG